MRASGVVLLVALAVLMIQVAWRALLWAVAQLGKAWRGDRS